MSFFKKLKNKLFKSSSKIDEGLDAIVNDGGEEDVVEVDEQAAIAAQEAEDARLMAEAEAAAENARQQEELTRAAEEAAAREAARIKEETLAKEREAERQRVEAQAKEEEAARQREAERARTEAAQKAADAQQQKEDEAAETARQEAAEKAREDEKLRLAAEAEAREAARLRDAILAQEREEERKREKAEADAREAEREAEAARLQEEELRRADEAARAEEERQREEAERPAPQAVMEPMTTLTASPLDEDDEDQPEEKKGIIGRLFGGGQKKTVVRRVLDDEMLEQLEELLITADMGVDTALRVTANMAEGRLGKKLSVAEIKQLLTDEITRIMDGVARPMPLYAHKPQVVLVVGVNGSGKTTTIGKLASQFKAAGKSVVIAAGDTFRAAAVEQLQVWGDRAGVPVLTAPEGSDPASLAFDAMEQASKDGADLLMIDTAGRLQNRADLMEELSKIVRVIRKKDPEAPHNILLVLDATTGQNALNQVKVFQELADVSGLVMTKLDGTAKGGVLVALADKFGLPIHAIGVGEQIDDLAPFDPEEFAKALVGLD